jgi:hypothetical protein
MLRAQITTEKVNTIRKLFIQGKFNQLKLSRDLGMSRTTIKNYVAEFKVIQEYYPDKLKNMQFFLKRITKNSQAEQIKEFNKLIPDLVATEHGVRLVVRTIWKRYLEIAVKPLTYSPFKRKFFQWCNDNDISFVSTKRITSFTAEERVTLTKWRNGNDHQKWQIAVVLLSANEHKSLLKVAAKVECTFPTVLRWLKIYETVGLT